MLKASTGGSGEGGEGGGGDGDTGGRREAQDGTDGGAITDADNSTTDAVNDDAVNNNAVNDDVAGIENDVVNSDDNDEDEEDDDDEDEEEDDMGKNGNPLYDIWPNAFVYRFRAVLIVANLVFRVVILEPQVEGGIASVVQLCATKTMF